MGDTASNMKPSDGSKLGTRDRVIDREETKDPGLVEVLGGLFGAFFARKESKNKEIPNDPKTFADMIDRADEKLEELIANKQKEYETETNEKVYNRKALNSLIAMRTHLDRLIEEIIEYTKLRSK